MEILEMMWPRWILKWAIYFVRSQMLLECADDMVLYAECNEWLNRYPSHTRSAEAKRKANFGLKW